MSWIKSLVQQTSLPDQEPSPLVVVQRKLLDGYGLGTSRKADVHDLRTALLHKRLGSCPLASRRWIAAAFSSRRLTLRMASVHAPSMAVAVTRDASTIVMARSQ
jgi:hypothetical protein